MMYNNWFIAIVSIIVLGFVWERILEYLNNKMWSNNLPDELKDIYSADEYAKSQQYDRDKKQISVIESVQGLVVILLALFGGWFGLLHEFMAYYTQSPVWQALGFFAILGIISDIIGLPYDLYGTFVIEERYGFNKTTPKTFVLDKVKGWLLGALIGGPLIALIVYIYTLTPQWFWLLGLSVMMVISLIMAMFYTHLILPLFNKLTPLENNDYRQSIESLSSKAGFNLKNIFVMDGSKRSTKANAFFSGIGPQKRIVLYDTLLDELSPEQTTAVLAHEIGHYKKHHTQWLLLFSLFSTAIMFYLLGLFLAEPALAQALGTSAPSFHIGVIAFGILFTPVSMVSGLLANVFSRRFEYQADDFAGNLTGGKPLIEALKKLSVKALSNLTPHPLTVFFYYSHPTLLQRIKNLKKW